MSHKSLLAAVTAFLLASAAFTPVKRLGDASCYWMISSSILYDRDLVYSPVDAKRALERVFDDLPSGIFVTEIGGKFIYAKPPHYSIVCLPFFALLKEKGFLIANSLMLAAIIAFLYEMLGKTTQSLLIALLFTLASNLYIYMYWIDPLVFISFLLVLSYYLWLRGRRALAMTALGVAASIRLLDAAMAAPLFLQVARERKLRELPLLIAAMAAPLAAVTAAYLMIYQKPTPYLCSCYYLTSKESFLNPRSGIYDPATVPLVSPLLSLKLIAYNLAYALVGRRSGILLYNTPLLLAIASAKTSDRLGREAFLFSIATVAASAILRPSYYQGGYLTIGNRYYAAYPLTALACRKPPRRHLLAAAVLSIVFSAPLASNPLYHSIMYKHHLWSPPYSFFPMEKTILGADPDIQGADYMGYYLDWNSYTAEEGFFWTRGGTSAKLFIKTRGHRALELSLIHI